jgi:hypothetical protein
MLVLVWVSGNQTKIVCNSQSEIETKFLIPFKKLKLRQFQFLNWNWNNSNWFIRTWIRDFS